TLIKPSSVNSTGKELPATTGAVTMETPKVGSVLGSVVAQGAANFAANSIAGPLRALGFTDAGATVLNKANAIASAAAAAQGEDITRGKQEINTAINNVGKATNLKEAATSFGNVIYTAFKNPKAFAAEVGSEIVEEILQIGPLKGLPFWTREAIGSAVENGGAAYNQEYANQLQQGATVQDAHKNAQIAAGAASAASLAAIGAGNLAAKGVSVLTGTADDVIGGLLGKTKAVGKTTIKESIQEMGEEGLIAAAVDKAVRGETNPANILTGMAGGGLYGGPTSGTMQATGIDKLENAFDITSQIKLSIDAGSNLSTATNNVVASSLTGAINSGQDINTAASTIVVGALNAG
ncbi:MAG: hypothetical protein EB117_18580, partial [Betaproteobacteria bacterium]|nr:hypothetical protein [Betaproteobacteria bacterium]